MPISDDLFQRFAALREACIDASSIIYMHKAGILDRVCHALQLYTVLAIINEVGQEVNGIHVLQPRDQTLTADAQLIQCARDRQVAIISEDKQILQSAKRAHLPYYNALMMLNWLLFMRVIDSAHYQNYHSALQACARYSDAVWSYGGAVHDCILNMSV